MGLKVVGRRKANNKGERIGHKGYKEIRTKRELKRLKIWCVAITKYDHIDF